MKSVFKQIQLGLILFSILASLTIADEISPKFGSSGEGDAVVNTTNDKMDMIMYHEFPFSDPRMRHNQRTYEQLIHQIIIRDLNSSNNITEATMKYPRNSPAILTIETKFAFHLVIDEKGVTLYTFRYNLRLNSCGATIEKLDLLNTIQKKGDLFNLQSVPNSRYRLIVEQLITEASKHTKYDEVQEISLFITVHPSLTFLPAAIIEDKLENLRADLPTFNVRYCEDCPNILSFDEYGYLTWFTAANEDPDSSYHYSEAKNQGVVNIGFHPKAIFVAYPIDIADKIDSGDAKIIKHKFCDLNRMETQGFVQNAYYERSPEKFANDMLFQFVKQSINKLDDVNQNITIDYPCYPKTYNEKIENILIKGSGDFKSCKQEIRSFMAKNYMKSESSQNFGLPTSEMPWPLEQLKGSELIDEASIYIESEDFENIVKHSLEKKFITVKMEDLVELIENYCTIFMVEKSEETAGFRNKKEYLNSCISLLYSSALLTKMGIAKTRDLRLKVTGALADGWIRGVTMRNLEIFHAQEKEWFFEAQDRALESYHISLKETEETDKEHALNVTFMIIMILSLVFWLGFIVRYRKADENLPTRVADNKTK